MLDGLRDYTVSMDIKSESEGDFFTFAAGKNNEKYVFYRVAEELFRFAATTDSWRDETELKIELDGTQWHNYTCVVNGADTRIYIDGVEVLHTTETHGQLADMGSGTSCYIGKSFYPEDTYFKGSIDNIRIYKAALTSEEISAETVVTGDVNNDGQFSVADLVAVQKYVLGKDELDNWQRGDLCKDNRVDTFDLCLMRKLVSNSK